MAASWDYFSDWPIFPYMLKRLIGQSYNNGVIQQSNSFQYGPVCIAGQLRGTNAFPKLFEEMRIALHKRYPIGITFINQINQRSYQAHCNRLQMDVIDEFTFNNNHYYSLAFDTARSVI
jgi:hypothetical protein